ncbi:MAG TPA: hypothetical protein PKE29_04965 [Phycisphaerales bacterium]|nr:hypothetical protein [Phycisphaerales bacterium]
MSIRQDLSAAVARTAVTLAGAGVVALTIAGCSKPLLAPTEERTPFDRYDNVRGRYAPQYVENEYGRREPNLRGRLGNKD